MAREGAECRSCLNIPEPDLVVMPLSRELQEIILYMMTTRHDAISRIILVFGVFYGSG